MIASKILIVLTVISCVAASSLKPRRMCLPSDMVTGPCHECVCALDGVYHCREKKCSQQTDKNGTIPVQEMECDPNMMYRENTLYCTCSLGGNWITSNCRERFLQLQPRNNTLMRHVVQSNETCIPHSLYLIDCNICRCNKEGHFGKFSCTNRFCSKTHKTDSCLFGDVIRTEDEVCSCSDINLYIDRLCIKVKDETVQILNETALEAIIVVGKHLERTQEAYMKECIPQTVFKIDCNRCICTDNKILACTDKMCVAPEDALRIGKHGSDSLPVLESEDDDCTPGLKYRFKCNTCMCSRAGVLSCTTMFCLED